MKRYGVFLAAMALVIALAVPALAAEPIDLTGTWKVTSIVIHGADRGFVEPEAPTGVFVVTEQRGRVFYGVKSWSRDGVTHEESFSGVVALDGEIYISEHEDGLQFGDVIDENHVVFYYVESGPQARAMAVELERQ